MSLRESVHALERDLRFGEPDYNEAIRARLIAMLSASESEAVPGTHSFWEQRNRRERISTAVLSGLAASRDDGPIVKMSVQLADALMLELDR